MMAKSARGRGAAGAMSNRRYFVRRSPSHLQESPGITSGSGGECGCCAAAAAGCTYCESYRRLSPSCLARIGTHENDGENPHARRLIGRMSP
jgi:hypothetical protein